MKEEVKPTPPATTETNTPKGGLFASMMSQKSFGSTPTQNSSFIEKILHLIIKRR